jgi:hypothetical protein
MKKIMTCCLIFSGLILVSRTFHKKEEPFLNAIKWALLKYVVDDTIEYHNINYVTIKNNKISPVSDTNLVKLYPDIKFYYFVIPYVNEYHDISTIAAVSGPNNDRFRFLFPPDYMHTGFDSIFINTEIRKNKIPTCYAISDFYVKAQHRNFDCCDEDMKHIVRKNIWNGNTLVVITAYTEYCSEGWFRDKKSKMADHICVVNTKFRFEHDTLRAVSFDDMRKN